MTKIIEGCIRNGKICIPIYYSYDEQGNINVDLDSIGEDYSNLLTDIMLNPSKYIHDVRKDKQTNK